jgi:MoaA/NifB/PqqE/SkfB family radical SAM enzyme
MLLTLLEKKLPTFHPNVQRKLVFNLLYHQLTRGEPIRDGYREKYKEFPPTFFAISPSMRCNLRCEGCYAAEYQKYGELTPDEFVGLIAQGRDDFGIHFYTILGGEPTAWPPMFDCVERCPDVFFQLYTHGQLFDEKMVERVVGLGNVTFAISVEGGEEETDRRRGPGAYGRIRRTMSLLREAGVPFGFSATHMTKNHRALADGSFYRDMLDAGCTFGWVFQYVPVGRDPSMDLVVTPKQRLERFRAIEEFRQANPMMIFDFWNDGEITDGCMAYGRRYFHVLSSGVVEPCVFVHFTKDGHNIREKSLMDIIHSDFYRDARSRMPFNTDRRAPCSFIDNPEILKDLVEKHDLKPSHPGAISVVTQHHGPLTMIADEYKKMLKEEEEPREKVGARA